MDVTLPQSTITLGLYILVLLALGLPVCLALGWVAGSTFTYRAYSGQKPIPSLSEIKESVTVTKSDAGDGDGDEDSDSTPRRTRLKIS